MKFHNLNKKAALNNLTLNTLKLNKGAERRLRTGHLWIYSNEVDTKHSPLKTFTKGEQVIVESAQGKALGVAMINPQNLICGRLVSRSTNALNKDSLKEKISSALSLRELCFSKPFYRLVYSESDFLPGLIIDRFGDYFSVQTNTAGMDTLKNEIVLVLEELFSPKGVLFKNDSSSRDMEGLEKEVVVGFGEIPELVSLEENDTQFVTSLLQGQKTGWFYDHRNNRREMQKLVKGKSVLDLFSYVGGWGVQALQAGASSVMCADSSQSALDIAMENAERNQAKNKFTVKQGAALDTLKMLVADKKLFDVIILDPPAFIKKSKDKNKGTEAYHHYNQLALRLLQPGGILISASCSMHLQHDELVNVVRVAGNQVDRDLQIFYQGGQGADHPVHPSIPETEYLKAVFVRA